MSDQRQWVELDPNNGAGTPTEAAAENAVIPPPEGAEPAAPQDSGGHGG